MHGPRMHGRDHDEASIRKRVTKMAKAGRVTAEEAERVASAASPDALEHAVREIRLRHIRSKLDADVDAGRLTKGEADLFIDRVQRGEDPRPPSRFRRRRPPQEDDNQRDGHPS